MANIISTLHTGFTSLGTSTTKTQLGGTAVILPAWAKSIFAVIPTAVIDTPTAAQSLIVSCDVESNDVSIMPYQVLCAPIGSGVGASISPWVAKPEKYAMNLNVNGGEQINVYETALDANTVAPYGSATLVISNQRSAQPMRHSKLGTYTASGTTTSADVNGTKYNFSGARHIVEVMGAFVPDAILELDAFAGYIKFTSNEFDGVSTITLPLNQIAGQLLGGAPKGACYIDGVSRLVVDVPLIPGLGQINVQDSLYMGLVPASEGHWVSGVVYEA